MTCLMVEHRNVVPHDQARTLFLFWATTVPTVAFHPQWVLHMHSLPKPLPSCSKSRKSSASMSSGYLPLGTHQMCRIWHLTPKKKNERQSLNIVYLCISNKKGELLESLRKTLGTFFSKLQCLSLSQTQGRHA